jgi:hypothetical protein
MWLLKYSLISLSIYLIGCSEAKLQEPPHEHFYQVGLFGHGRGILGDLRLNSFYFERQCDSCHATETDEHGSLGRCNQCHQPHIAGWNKSLLPKAHAALPLIDRPHHNKLSCTSCHQTLNNRIGFNTTRCQQCHNHQASDIDYAHDLMDNYNYDDFSKLGACLACHSRNGSQYADYFDLESGDSL